MRNDVITRMTAIAPIVMSGIAVALVIGQLALVGTARQHDEGTAAHLWQTLMGSSP